MCSLQPLRYPRALSRKIAAHTVVPLSQTWQPAAAIVVVITSDVDLAQAVGVVRDRSWGADAGA